MPRTKRSLGEPESAQRQFTDREDFLEAFEVALAALQPDRHSVLTYYGVGGIGKTTLLQEIRRRLREERPQVAHARLDFRDDANRLPATALLRVRSALREAHGIRFPSFDIAFAVYWRLAHPHLPLTKSELSFLAEGEVAGDVIGALAEIPVVGMVARIPRILDRASRLAREWWTRRGQAELRNIAALDDPAAVEEWLPAFWGADLKAWLAEDPARRVVVFLDTLEALWEGRSQGERGAPPDDWVRDWAGHLEGVLLVVAGREKLRWTEHDETWQELIEQHLVGALAPEDSERFLRTAGVAEPEVRSAIVERSEGVPFYLDLAVDTYEKIRTAEGRAPHPEEFDQNLSALLDRLLHYLAVTEKAALFVLSVPETFDLERFRDLMRTFSTGHPASALGLEALRRYSFVEEPELGRYTLHALIREALAAKDDPDGRAQVHGHLFAQAQRALEGLDPRALTDHHRRALREGKVHGQARLEPEAFLKWYWDVEGPFKQAADWRFLLPLREAMLEYAEQRLGPEHPEALVAGNNLAYALVSKGRTADAEPLFRRALEGLQRVRGAEHQDTLTALNNFATFLSMRGEDAEAERLYRQALDACERALGPEHPDTLSSLNNLAHLLHTQRRFAEAEPLYRRALEARERVLGAEHPATLTSLNNLGGLLSRRGRREEAEPLLRRAVEVSEHVLGPDHPSTLTSVNNLAGLLMEGGRPEETEPLFRRALDGLERELGTEHPSTLIAVHNLAFLLENQDRLEAAEPLYRRTLEARERMLGPDHPDTRLVRKNLHALLHKLNRPER